MATNGASTVAGPSTAGPAPPADSASDVDTLWRSAGWDTTPLFMRSLPSLDPASSSKPSEHDRTALEALQSLVFESSAEETVRQLKERGNELFKLRKWKEAKGFYDQAVREVLENPRWREEKEKEREGEKVVEIGEEGEDEVKDATRRAVYSNRAACNLELQNFASCLRDCASALAPPLPSPSSPTIRKSLFRSARASYQLGKLDDAIDALERLRTLDEKEGRGVDKDGEALRKKVEDRRVQKMKQEEEKKRRENADKAFGSSLRAAFENRGLVIPKGLPFPIPSSSLPPNVIPASFDPNSLPAVLMSGTPPPVTTPLTYPVYVLRPLADPPTRDLVLAWHEDAVISDHLASFSAPPPSSEYTPETSSLYITTQSGRVLKMGKGLTLRKVIKGARKVDEKGVDGIELLGGWCMEVVWLPDGEGSKRWIEEYKKSKGRA